MELHGSSFNERGSIRRGFNDLNVMEHDKAIFAFFVGAICGDGCTLFSRDARFFELFSLSPFFLVW
jgi:hypothetical protein